MRKLILASALLLASASAHAGEIKGLGLAANDAPVVAVADTARPLPPPLGVRDAETAGDRTGTAALAAEGF